MLFFHSTICFGRQAIKKRTTPSCPCGYKPRGYLASPSSLDFKARNCFMYFIYSICARLEQSQRQWQLSVRKFCDVNSVPEKELAWQRDFGLLAVPVKLCLVINLADLVSVHLSHFSRITHARACASTCVRVTLLSPLALTDSWTQRFSLSSAIPHTSVLAVCGLPCPPLLCKIRLNESDHWLNSVYIH